MLLNRRLQRSRVRADDLADLAAVLEQQESGHGAHAVLLRGLGDLVDVDLVEARGGVVVREPVVKRSVSMERGLQRGWLPGGL